MSPTEKPKAGILYGASEDAVSRSFQIERMCPTLHADSLSMMIVNVEASLKFIKNMLPVDAEAADGRANRA